MIEFLRVAALAAVVVFCIFRVAEVDWQRTWLPEILGYLLAGIGAFWQLLLLSSRYVLMVSAQLQDAMADVLFYVGVGLILFAATCWRAKRRYSEQAEARPEGSPALALVRSTRSDEESRAA